MSVAFDNEPEQLSSSASSSFISEEPMSDPRGNPSPVPAAGSARSPESTAAPASPTNTHAVGPGGPNDLNVNKVSGTRSGVAEKPLNGSPASRGFNRFVDPKDENGYVGVTRRTNSATVTTSAAAAGGAAHPSPTRTLNPVFGGAATRPTASSATTTTATTTAAGAASWNGSSSSVPALVADFAKQITEKFLKCVVCGKVATDPVVITPQSSLVCRRCAVSLTGAAWVELPKSLRDGMRELKAACGMPEGDSDSIAERRILRAKRNGATNAAAAAADAASNAGVPPSVVKELKELTEAEAAERVQIDANRETSLAELASRKAAEMARLAAAAAVSSVHKTPTLTSRQFKLEADRKYEGAEYTAALELYSKAISLQPVDKMTNLKFLYGNRSAAFYMAQRYSDCIADCLEVVRLEPTNTKMISRAARAACTMGDLQRSVDILQSVPKERRSEENESDLIRYRASLDTFRHAERCFGTPEGDEQYRMLVAQYSDAVPFRIRSAESLLKQKHFMRAVEVLDVLTSSSRTPTACRIMAECLYLSGFEHFDRAKKCLIDAAQLDDECSALLKKIDAVDDGKQNGNMNFNKKNYGSAAEYYTVAIRAAADNDQVLRVLYCNRAAAYKELGRYREGVEDCTKTLAIDKEFFKAYARRARCHEHLGDHFAAVRDYKKAMEYDSTDRELARELRGAEQNLAKEAEREKDFYYQLGVSRSATEREIKLKYRELSLRWHPDKCIGMDEMERERAEHKFKIISEAYTTLVDQAKRREYDLKQDREKYTRPGGFGFASTYSGSSNEYFRGRHRAGGNGFW
jgi:tetratricopeptide (TPR) repeat protein